MALVLLGVGLGLGLGAGSPAPPGVLGIALAASCPGQGPIQRVVIRAASGQIDRIVSVRVRGPEVQVSLAPGRYTVLGQSVVVHSGQGQHMLSGPVCLGG
jgi:hypothetical protein